MTDFVICSHSREGKTPSNSRINMVSLGLFIRQGYQKYLNSIIVLCALACMHFFFHNHIFKMKLKLEEI